LDIGTDRRRVVVLSATARSALDRLEPLGRGGLEVQSPGPNLRLDSLHAVVAALQGAWACVAGPEPYGADLIAGVPSLRAIARTGVGYDAIDVEAATRHGVAVLNTPGANSQSVADFTLALMLGCMRRLSALEAAVRDGTWRPDGLARDLFGSTVGIVGLGRVGRAVARRLVGFGCRMLAVEPEPDHALCAELGIELIDLSDMLPQVDVITFHVPLQANTRHLMGATEFALVRPGAVIVNTSRGPVVDERALVDALLSGRVASAGLDVFETEPLPRGHPLLNLPNVLVSGHSAAFTRGAAINMVDAVAQGLADLASGRVPQNCVNREALERMRAGKGAGH
jgi:D-3-phosphoglycerate dehydrogenase / 2-oxoglutarate reductase